jgi:RNA polymerase sigma-54 factor
MKMDFALSMQQTQKLVMTQQLQMAIKILQMSSIELNEYVEEQVVENPVLDIEIEEKKQAENEIDWGEVAKNSEWDYYHASDTEFNSNEYEEDEGTSPLNFIESTVTLRDHLIMQLNLTVSDKLKLSIGEYLIDNIDSSGYLKVDLADVAGALEVSIKDVEDILYIIQTFDPSGIGARDLKECLLIQLKELGTFTEIFEKVIDKYLNEIGENKYGLIAKELNITPEEAQSIGDIIKSLEPKPGSGFADNEVIKYVSPDASVDKIDGEYVVTLNEGITPRLVINKYYRNILKSNDNDEIVKDFIKGKLDSAAWLIKSIDQRKTTLFNVVNFIIHYQEDFLDKGIEYLKPLTLKDVAENIGVHESTVSRAISGKYVQTNRGLYQLKFFFSRGLYAGAKGNISTESIKVKIKEIIELEDIKKPLSDQAITDILNKSRIDISRRTVAKYREELNIPSASKRKRY